MNFRRAQAEGDLDARMDITSLIDVVFLLVIFLLVTTTFRTEEYAFDIVLPQAGAEASTIEAPNHTIFVKKSGQLFYLTRDEGEASGDPQQPLDKDTLVAALRAAHEHNPEVEVHVRAGKEVPDQAVIDAIDACHQAGVQRLSFPYELQRALDAGAPPQAPAPAPPAP